MRPIAFAALLASGFVSIAAGADTPIDHPRPQMVREAWMSLDGPWRFALDPEDEGRGERWFATDPGERFTHAIVVPYPWQSKASGVALPDYKGAAWYRRTVRLDEKLRRTDKRIRLHINRADYSTEAWVNGKPIGRHDGGYMPFSFDITEALDRDGENVIVLRVEDFERNEQPTGLQTRFTSISGVWGSVWLEASPRTRLLSISSDRIEVEPHETDNGKQFEIVASGPAIADPLPEGFRWPRFKCDTKSRGGYEVRLRLPMAEGADTRPWTPEHPNLLTLTFTLRVVGDESDADADVVHATIAAPGRPTLERGSDPLHEFFAVDGERIFLRGAGYTAMWPDTLGTASSSEAIRRDLELAKSFGMNALRLKGTLPSPRMVHIANQVGVVLMVDLPGVRSVAFHDRSTLEDWSSDFYTGGERWYWSRPWDAMCRQLIRRYQRAPSIWMVTQMDRRMPIGDSAYEARVNHWLHWRWHELYSKGGFHTVAWHRNTGRCIQPSWWDLTLKTRRYEAARTDLQLQLARNRYRIFEEETVNHTDQRRECLIVSDYGRTDWWTRDTEIASHLLQLTGLVRSVPQLAGSFWCDLTDTEHEKYGLVRCNRKPKAFDYDALATGWLPRHLFSDQFLRIEAPLRNEARPGVRLSVPAMLVIAHDRPLPEQVDVIWEARFTDSLGDTRELAKTTLPLQTRQIRQRFAPFRLRDFTVPIPRERGIVIVSVRIPALDMVTAAVVDVAGKATAPAENQLALTFLPGDYENATGQMVHNGARYGQQLLMIEGEGEVVYRFALPQAARQGALKSAALVFEVASCAGDQRVDLDLPDYPWSRKANLLHMEDYRVRLSGDALEHERRPIGKPQTDGLTWPTALQASINGIALPAYGIEHDYAGARGVLSNETGLTPGTYGQKVVIPITAKQWQAALKAASDGSLTLKLSFGPMDGAERGGGLSLYGDRLGALPLRPHLLLSFEEAAAGLGQALPLEPLDPQWRGGNPYITQWRVLGPAEEVDQEAAPDDTWRAVAATAAPFAAWRGRSKRVPRHAMPLVELSQGGKSRNASEALAVAYLYLPEDRTVAIWTGGTDPWKVTPTTAAGKTLKPLGLYHQWLGVVPDARMGRYRLTKGWNEIRVWTRHDIGGRWQFSVAVTDTRGRIMDDIRLAARPTADTPDTAPDE